VPESRDQSTGRWVFKATVYKSSGTRGFVGYGDADLSNVSTLVHGAEMRIAETRAVNHALRKAYGIGLCSVGGWASENWPQRTDFSGGCRLTSAGRATRIFLNKGWQWGGNHAAVQFSLSSLQKRVFKNSDNFRAREEQDRLPAL